MMTSHETQSNVDSTIELEDSSFGGQRGAALFLTNPITCRLVESAAMQLGLSIATLNLDSLDPDLLWNFEVVLADASAARALRSLFRQDANKAMTVRPALIAVVQHDELVSVEGEGESEGKSFDGLLTLPLERAALVTQCSVILYAHRAYMKRLDSALEELRLNRKIFRSVSSGITVARYGHPDLPLIYVNPAFESMTGYSFEEVRGTNCRFLQGNDHDQPGVALIREAVKAERKVTAILKNYRKDGTFFWNELSLSPIRNHEGKLTHFVGIQNDVTARVEFETALLESEKLAAVGRLAASIAHEINNPLEAVTNLLYLARTSTETEEVQRYLLLADTELQRASQITSQSLRFYKQSTSPQAVRPAAMLDSVLDLYQGKIDNARVVVERRQRMTASIICLESEIRQVLSNLVRNAIDAMRSNGGGRLLVRSREATDLRPSSEMRGTMLTIADTGCGIGLDAMKRLFTPFFTTKGASGTGLGLWVSSEIVSRHAGRIRVRSSQKEGASWTVFQLFLPFQPRH